MQEILVNIHNIWRWLVLIAAVAAIVLALLAATGSRPWDATSDRLGLIFTITMDIQVLVGIIIWLLEQRWSGDAYLGYIHPILMLGAVALAHVGRSRADKAQGSPVKGRTAAIFFTASLVVVLLAIPFKAWPL